LISKTKYSEICQKPQTRCISDCCTWNQS